MAHRRHRLRVRRPGAHGPDAEPARAARHAGDHAEAAGAGALRRRAAQALRPGHRRDADRRGCRPRARLRPGDGGRRAARPRDRGRDARVGLRHLHRLHDLRRAHADRCDSRDGVRALQRRLAGSARTRLTVRYPRVHAARTAVVHPGVVRVHARAARAQRPRLVQGEQAALRGGGAGAGVRVHQRVRRTPAGDRPALRRRSEPHRRLALPDLPRHPLQQGQDALQDAHGHPLPAREGEGRPRARLLPPSRAAQRLRRRRNLATRDRHAGPDPGRDRPQTGGVDGRGAGHRARRGRPAQATAGRLRPRPPADRRPQAQELRRRLQADREDRHLESASPPSSPARSRPPRRSCASSAGRSPCPSSAD